MTTTQQQLSSSFSSSSTTTTNVRQVKRQSLSLDKPHNNVDDDPSFVDLTNYQGPARAFPMFSYPFPCILLPKSQALMRTTPASVGLMFQRPYKTGSTTMAGVVMRIARRKAQERIRQLSLLLLARGATTKVKNIPPPTRTEYAYISSILFANSTNPYINTTTSFTTSNQTEFFCQHRSNHGSAVSYGYGERDKTQSFLMTLVRNPTNRVISQFFHFGVSVYRMEPTDAIFQRYLLYKMRANPMLTDAALYHLPDAAGSTILRRPPTTNPLIAANTTMAMANDVAAINNNNNNSSMINLTSIVQDVLDGYDFIGVTERFDESLVALKMLLNLTFADILYTRNRSGGSFTNGDKSRPCIYVVPSFLTPGMKDFFKSHVWKERIRGEILLYQAAWKSLDLTIDRLGRLEFKIQLQQFQQWNAMAQSTCEPRQVGMCTANGVAMPIQNRTCIIWSEGCSDTCLDEIL